MQAIIIRSAVAAFALAAVLGAGPAAAETLMFKSTMNASEELTKNVLATGCTAIGALRTPDGKVSMEIANTTLTGKGSKAGQQVANNVKAATYVITFATTCSWTAAVYRQ